MRALTLPLRWSWRDLRSHVAKVVAIALVIAIGTGGYAGLTSTTEWRRISYAAAYSQLGMYDLKVQLPRGGFVDEGELATVIDTIASADVVDDFEERLIVPIQVDASTADATVIVRGEMVGSDFSSGGPHVNSYHATGGRLLTYADTGQPVVMVETAFADFYELPHTGFISLSGGRRLEYVGTVSTPEYFTVAPEGEISMSEATFVGVFTTLETAQAVARLPGLVNELVLTLDHSADPSMVATELQASVAGLGGSVTTREDNLSYSSLVNDIDQDQAMFNALAILLLVGAIGAAVNLIHRMVQEQRREIGIGLAMGVRPSVLAVRPLLVSAQISILGALFGVGVGVLTGNAMGRVFTRLIPLPAWDTSFQPSAFVPVAIAGAILPLLASVVPVLNAVKVRPIEAIRPTHLISSTRGRRGRRRHRSSSFNMMPFHNLTRARRRTVLTVLGLGASVTVLVGFLGLTDSVHDAIDTAEYEAMAGSPDRILVGLNGFHITNSPAVAAVADAESVGRAEATLSLYGSLRSGEVEIDTSLELTDLEGGAWAPTFTTGAVGEGGGVIITDKAARDLGVSVGDTIVLHHPRRQGLMSYTMVESQLPVLGTHPYPLRGLTYMDSGDASIFNLAGITNALTLDPAPGTTVADVQRELFDMESVASVVAVRAITESVRNAFDEVLGVIDVMAVAVLLLVLLIAFNTASINLESRARQHATMFAYGVKVRTALRIAATEGFVLGVAATVVGLAGGSTMVWWITSEVLGNTMPDVALRVVLRPLTLALTAGLGILAVTVAPVLTVRRMRRMDLPGTLRLVE